MKKALKHNASSPLQRILLRQQARMQLKQTQSDLLMAASTNQHQKIAQLIQHWLKQSKR